MTKSFLNTMQKIGRNATITSIITEMRNFLKINKYSQIPQLTCNKMFSIQTEQFIPQLPINNRNVIKTKNSRNEPIINNEPLDDNGYNNSLDQIDKLNCIIKGLIYDNELLNSKNIEYEIKNKNLSIALNNVNRKLINIKSIIS
jgi:hypothetical protein